MTAPLPAPAATDRLVPGRWHPGRRGILATILVAAAVVRSRAIEGPAY